MSKFYVSRHKKLNKIIADIFKTERSKRFENRELLARKLGIDVSHLGVREHTGVGSIRLFVEHCRALDLQPGEVLDAALQQHDLNNIFK